MKEASSDNAIGIDLGDKKHAICVLDKRGEVAREDTISNTSGQLEGLAACYPGAVVAMEVGTHSPWISRLLEGLGMDVVVANPRKLRAIYQNDRKSDREDARMLARLVRADRELLGPVRHGSEGSQRELLAIKLRDTLARRRVDLVSSVRMSLKALGIALPAADVTTFPRHARAHLAGHPDEQSMVEPLLEAIECLTDKVGDFDRAIAQEIASGHPEVDVLRQIPGVGPITALSFVLYLEDPSRFPDARDVGAYLGLVPGRDQSGNCDRQLGITKAGNRYLRGLLVQCAQYILGHHGPDCDLRRHGLKLVARGGKGAKKKAVIAIARKLAVLMVVLWRDRAAYEPLRGSAA